MEQMMLKSLFCWRGHCDCDVEQGIGLRRSKPGAALIFVERDTIYSIPVVELREVLHGVRSECGISRVLTTEARMMEVEA